MSNPVLLVHSQALNYGTLKPHENYMLLNSALRIFILSQTNNWKKKDFLLRKFCTTVCTIFSIPAFNLEGPATWTVETENSTLCLCEFPMDEKSEAKKKDRELIHCRKKRTEFSSHTLHPNGRAQRGLNTSRQPTQNGNWGCYTIYGPSFRTKLINKQNYHYQQLLLM